MRPSGGRAGSRGRAAPLTGFPMTSGPTQAVGSVRGRQVGAAWQPGRTGWKRRLPSTFSELMTPGSTCRSAGLLGVWDTCSRTDVLCYFGTNPTRTELQLRLIPFGSTWRLTQLPKSVWITRPRQFSGGMNQHRCLD